MYQALSILQNLALNHPKNSFRGMNRDLKHNSIGRQQTWADYSRKRPRFLATVTYFDKISILERWSGAERSLINPRCLSGPLWLTSAGTFPSSIHRRFFFSLLAPPNTVLHVRGNAWHPAGNIQLARRSFGKSKSTVWSSYFLNTT